MRTLGKTKIEVSPLCLGGNVFGWTIDERRSFEVLDAFVEAGGNFIDTADVYSAWVPGNRGGESEAILGAWMAARKNRDRVVIATKLGSPMPYGKGLSAAHIAKAADESLKRLRVERIDLLYAHRDDEAAPQEETARAFDALVRAGKVRAIGASNFEADRLKSALEISRREGLARYEVLQPYYHLAGREDFEGALQALCETEHLSVAPYYALASGFLTGKYRRNGPKPSSPRAENVLKTYGNDAGWAVLEAAEGVSRKHGATVAQVALAWLFAQPTIVAPIASATSVEQLRELVTFDKVKLDADDRKALDLR